jgi:hypothetical protein
VLWLKLAISPSPRSLAVFAGLVLLATQVLPVKTPVAVAAATLAAVALFNPLRKQVQRAVDRRFNRSHYNAEAVVAAFGQPLSAQFNGTGPAGDLSRTGIEVSPPVL